MVYPVYIYCYSISSFACLINLGDTFVITGGGYSDNPNDRVTKYNSAGHVGDLEPLKQPRRIHGCAAYTDGNEQVGEDNYHCNKINY